MPSNASERDEALRTLKSFRTAGSEQLMLSLRAMRFNRQPGDEVYMLPIIDEESDEMVVAWALYSLWQLPGVQDSLLPRVMDLAQGDVRDTGEMPIQTMAIMLLGKAANNNSTIRGLLLKIASKPGTPDCPRSRAWQVLAELCGIEWSEDFSEQMIMDHESGNSAVIKKSVTDGLLRKFGGRAGAW